MSPKDAPQKMQFLGTIKKLASLVPEATKCKVVENTHNFGRHRTKIGPNPDVLGYSKSPGTWANMHIWVYW